MVFDNMPILVVIVLSVIGHNQTVAIAATLLLLLKLLGLEVWFPFIEKHALFAGITVLTLAMLVSTRVFRSVR